MGKRQRNLKGERFLKLTYPIITSTNWGMLTGSSVKLLIEIAGQYNGSNNGDLSATYSTLCKRGWNSKQTLKNAVDCLLHYGFITKTRQGGKNKCNLYAVTWYGIDYCSNKLDAHPNPNASHKWQKEVEKWNSKN